MTRLRNDIELTLRRDGSTQANHGLATSELQLLKLMDD
jgi:hypothetical protein